MEEVLASAMGQFFDFFNTCVSRSNLPRHCHHHRHHCRWCVSYTDEGLGDDGSGFILSTEKARKRKKSTFCNVRLSKKSKKVHDRPIIPENNGTIEVMKQEIWKDFPEDLFQLVIAHLPVAAFIRLRVVCKKWSSLINTPSFADLCNQVPRIPWVLTIPHDGSNSCAMYDPSCGKWYRHAVPWLRSNMTLLPVASAGGLVCCVGMGNRTFYIGNPLTESYRELPARSYKVVWSRAIVGMITIQDGYMIIWITCDGDYEVYDSAKCLWTRPGNMPSNIKIPLAFNYKSQAVTVDTTAYFLHSMPDGILSYDLLTGAWEQYLIPAPLHLCDHALAKCGGRILLVGLLMKNAATCLCIWELQKMTLLWKEVDRMPNLWCLEFYGRYINMSCVGNKDVLMLSLRSRQLYRLIAYNLATKEWIKIPSLISQRRKRQWVTCGTSFHPCPTAKA